MEIDANGTNRPDYRSNDPYVTRVGTNVRSGLYAMRLGPDTGIYSVSQTVSGIQAGKLYAVAGSFKIPAPATPDPSGFSVQLRVQWLSSTGTVLRVSRVGSIMTTAGAAWVPQAARIRAPAGATRAIVAITAKSLSVPIYVDDVTMVGQ